MATRGSRSEKVKRIFQQFDGNTDGGLNRAEMATLVVAVNPRVKFSEEQINAILDEVFKTYADFIDGERGLTYDGLLRTYDDGAGDVDRDFDALGLELRPETAASDGGASSSIPDERAAVEPHNKQRTAVWAASPNHGIVFDDTWKIVDDVEMLIKRLKSKQAKDGKWKGDNVDVADGARSREEAFDGHMAIGRILYEHQLYKEALVSFKRACELQPTDVRPHFRAGNCLYFLGRHSDAKEEFLLALEAAEASGNQLSYLLPQIHVNLGIALEGEGMVISSCEHYREAAILCPTHFRALKLLGSALFGVGEYKAAVKALEEAIYLKNDYADAHCDLASALHSMGDDENAIKVFQKAIDLKPGHVDALYNLGGLYMDMGRYQRASEMYTRVLGVWPNHWRAQLNKAVSLLGAGETEESKKALKEALQMTNRVELHDAILHLKQLQKKRLKGNGGTNGEEVFIIVEPSKFKTVGEKTTVRQELANALAVRAFQRITRLSRCDVELLKKEMTENDAPVSYSGRGVPEKSIRKASLEVELIWACVLLFLHQFVVGLLKKRKRAAFDSLLWRPVNEDSTQIRKVDALKYIKLLRAIYIPGHGMSEILEIHGETASMVSLTEFLVMFDDPDWGFGIMSCLLKLEAVDRNRQGNQVCSVCRYPIIGPRFKEMKSHFSLCSQCYSEGKVPPTFKQEEYRFKEYASEGEAMKDKCMWFSLHSKSSSQSTTTTA
ncbi:calcium-binding tetratricopeptide family protein [Actinidia rufa]|uniref:Calcium-binding tetratricopeptide family protein n=1 Tax=Actinidia rufa TaxID=165716 RepID=A0A7J0GHX5_9ERIC|nr:calcium-binding tetratricopeptide family protein [Actinidia rufa]